MARPLFQHSIAVATLVSVLSGCSQLSSAREEASNPAPGAESSAAPNNARTTVKTAQLPTDACGWIPAAEVEQVVGKLEGPPRAAGDECIYPLAEKSRAFASLLEMRRQFRGNRPGKDDDHVFHDVVKVSVDVTGADFIIGNLATNAVSKMFTKELGQSPSGQSEKEPAPPGWDSVGGLPYTWIGRTGHVAIFVFSPPEISDEQKMALAARVRDRIPDLPFPTDNTYQVPTFDSNDRNPCDLLTRAEAEAVLGRLVVEPYRAIENSPLAYEKGKACAYHTAGHRVFVITPEWTDGASEFNMGRGIGEFIGSQIPFEKASIEGPWDKGVVNGTTGSLLLLKGDRLLEVDYLTSSADRSGALKLAAQAMQRLAS